MATQTRCVEGENGERSGGRRSCLCERKKKETDIFLRSLTKFAQVSSGARSSSEVDREADGATRAHASHSTPNVGARWQVEDAEGDMSETERARWTLSLQWVDSLSVARPLAGSTVAEVAHRLRSGVLLCALAEASHPRLRLRGVAAPPRSRAEAASNVVLALETSPALRSSARAVAAGVVEGRVEHARRLLPALFETWCVRPARARAGPVLAWLQHTAAHYGYRVCVSSSNAEVWRGLWEEFSDGVVLALLAHWSGGDGLLDLRRVFGAPVTLAQRERNLETALTTLASLRVPILVQSDEWNASLPDDDAALAQLHAVWAVLHRLPSPLPSAPGRVELPHAGLSHAVAAGEVSEALEGAPVVPRSGTVRVRAAASGEAFFEYVVGATFADGPPVWVGADDDADASAGGAAADAGVHDVIQPHIHDKDDEEERCEGDGADGGDAASVASWRHGMMHHDHDQHLEHDEHDEAEGQKKDEGEEVGVGKKADEDEGEEWSAEEALMAYTSERERKLEHAMEALAQSGRDVHNPAVRRLAEQWAADKARKWAESEGIVGILPAAVLEVPEGGGGNAQAGVEDGGPVAEEAKEDEAGVGGGGRRKEEVRRRRCGTNEGRWP